VEAACAAAGLPFEADASLDIAEELVDRLAAARQAERDLAERKHTLSDRRRMLEAKRARQEALQQEIAAVVERAGAGSTGGMAAAVQAADQALAFDRTMRDRDRELRLLLREEWPQAEPELATLTVQEADDEERRLTEQIDLLEEACRREVAAEGAIDDRLNSLGNDTASVALAGKVEQLRAELSSAVDQYAPLALTQLLMQRALKRFEAEHQPRLLTVVADLLRRMTQGEYVDIRRTLEGERELVVVGKDGAGKRPHELSTGTREQLYLAIRLAYVADYSRQSEPLPVVMDDVLVNFDEDRARQTLRVLQETSQHAQVLLLTCHRRTARLWQEISPEASILELAAGTLAEECETPVEAADKRRQRKPRGAKRPAEAPALFPGQAAR
jgi:uncharacterized protein YhaN